MAFGNLESSSIRNAERVVIAWLIILAFSVPTVLAWPSIYKVLEGKDGLLGSRHLARSRRRFLRYVLANKAR